MPTAEPQEEVLDRFGYQQAQRCAVSRMGIHPQ
jgi:hypothetical protein